MYISFLKTLTDAQVLVLFPFLACCALFLLAALFRCFSKPLGLVERDWDVIDTATQNTMSGAYVVLGFVLVLAMTTVSDLDSSVSQEASTLKSIERLLVLDGSKQALESREHLLTYTESLINDEWPDLKDGHGNTQTSSALKKLFLSLDAFDPKTPKDTILYEKILGQTDKAAELRNTRILNIQSNLPQTFYLVSLLSLIGVLVIAALRLSEATPMRTIALTTQVIMLTLMLSAVVIIDLPYLGETVTSPDTIQTALESMRARVLPIH